MVLLVVRAQLSRVSSLIGNELQVDLPSLHTVAQREDHRAFSSDILNTVYLILHSDLSFDECSFDEFLEVGPEDEFIEEVIWKCE